MKLWVVGVCLFPFICFSNVKIGVFNDINGSYGSLKYSPRVKSSVEHLVNGSPDIVVMAGDLIAGQKSSLSTDRVKSMWNVFERDIYSKFKQYQIPLIPAAGNHDAGHTRDRVEFKRFWMKSDSIPNIEYIDTTHYPFFYAYKVKGILLIAIDDTKKGRLISYPYSLGGQSNQAKLKKDLNRIQNQDLPAGSYNPDMSQKVWLKKILESEASKSAKARIVYGHIPLYSVLDPKRYSKPGNRGKFNEVLSNEQLANNKTDGLEKILLDGNVSLAIFGHSHTFYPATIKHKNSSQELKVLFTPCAGPGSRHLPGSKNRSPVGYSFINIDDSGKIQIETFKYNGEIINKNNLPRKIKLKNNVTLERL